VVLGGSQWCSAVVSGARRSEGATEGRSRAAQAGHIRETTHKCTQRQRPDGHPVKTNRKRNMKTKRKRKERGDEVYRNVHRAHPGGQRQNIERDSCSLYTVGLRAHARTHALAHTRAHAHTAKRARCTAECCVAKLVRCVAKLVRCVATCCATLQRVALCSNVLRCCNASYPGKARRNAAQLIATPRSALQRVATTARRVAAACSGACNRV
jgi:hypothetical protein